MHEPGAGGRVLPSETAAASMTGAASRNRRRERSRGQVIVIFAGAMLAFIGLMAVVIDISWYWANTLRVQRAADAAALAGVVWLPNQYGTADTTAKAEATKNGYANGGVTTVTTVQDATNNRRLDVTVSTRIDTFFARVVGISTIPITRTAKAEFILPVPMGSPENYYGVFGPVRDATFTGTTHSNTDWDPPTAVPSTVWTSPTNADSLTLDNAYAVTPASNGSQQRWQNFNLTSGGGAIPSGATIDGIQVAFNGALLTGSGATVTNCNFGAQVTWNASLATPTWSTMLNSAPLTTTKGVPANNIVGSASSLAAWGAHSWVQSDFTNTNFQVRLTWNQTSCSATRTGSLDNLAVKVSYHYTTTTTTNNNLQGPGSGCANGLTDCFRPDGQVLNPRGFWGTMNTEGAANVNGDAYQPYYDTPTSTVAPACPVNTFRACYDAVTYYNYAIDVPAGTTGVHVYVFDPTFCATQVQSGTGDRWFGGTNAVSSWYELYNTNNTPYNLLDDTQLATSGSKFTNISASDTTMGGSGGSECKQTDALYNDGRDYHDEWYLLNPGAGLDGGPNGTVYRLHTTGTDPANGAAQRNTNGEQSFAIFANAASGTAPDVYGLGAMQMFSPLELAGGSGYSEFYIAQVPSAHAGKTLELSLWDPGDTNTLSANIQIEIPTSGGWAATPFNWSAVPGTSNSGAQPCTATGTNVNSVTTNVGGGSTGIFNGCWLTIDVTIPQNYAAYQNGWWKIRYNMSGSGTSFDVTTWTAKIRGNPVHLVLP